MQSKKIFVVDTCIILDDYNNLKLLSNNNENIIVVPETVLMELEDKKKELSTIGLQAREFIRKLLKGKELKTVEKNNDYGEYNIVKFLNEDNIEIHIFSKEKYNTEILGVSNSEVNDKRIIEVAKLANIYYRGQKVIFVTLDGYATVLAKLKRVKTENLNKNKIDKNFVFHKTIKIPQKELQTIDLKSIIEIDPDYKKENFAYTFLAKENENLQVFGNIVNGRVELFNKNDVEGVFVKPVNIKQKLLMKAIISDNYDLHLVDARAGSGKTLIALVSAMHLLRKNKGKYNKIIYVRNSIESLDRGADIGYLSGNDEKLRIYNMALQDTLEFITTKLIEKNKKTEEITKEILETKVEELKSKFNIQTLWPGEARGRNLSKTIFILDEWQNSSEKTTQLILSRLDDTCKAIVIGSVKQIDNMYLNKLNNGLTSLKNILVNDSELLKFYCIDLEKSVRGKFAYFADEVFS